MDRAPDDPASANLEVTFYRDETSSRSIYDPIIAPAGAGDPQPSASRRRHLIPPPDPAVLVTRARQ